MKQKQIKALQNILASLADNPPESLRKDIATMQQYLKEVLAGDGSIKEKDFEMIWAQYPNRVGKKAAERHFFATVKTGEQLQRIWTALDHYLASEKVLKGFVQNGSTWFNDWQSWVEPTPAMMGTAVHRIEEQKTRSDEEKKKFLGREK